MLLEVDNCFSAYILETFFQGSNTALRKIDVRIVAKTLEWLTKMLFLYIYFVLP